MTVKPENDTLELAQNLAIRNKEVERCFNLVIQGCRKLLGAFEHQKYRTVIEIDHTKSDKDTKLIKEFLCSFFNVTLTKNRADYDMIYLTYSEEAVSRFGARLYNRVIRQLYKHTTYEGKKVNVEDCVRLNELGKVEQFFIGRLTNGENAFTSISIEEKA